MVGWNYIADPFWAGSPLATGAPWSSVFILILRNWLWLAGNALISQVNRLSVFWADLAANVALTLHAPSVAAQTVAGASNALHYRFCVSDIWVTVVIDGTLTGSPRLFAGNANADDLGRELRAELNSPDSTPLNLNMPLLEVAGRKVLVEAGAAKTMGPDGGALFANLAAIGVRAEKFDAVIVIHTDPGHVSNRRRDDGGAAFPNAAVHVPETNWNVFVRDEPDLSRLPMPPEFRQRFIATIKRSVEPIACTAILYRRQRDPAGQHPHPGGRPYARHGGAADPFRRGPAARHLGRGLRPLVNMERLWRPSPDFDQEAAARLRRVAPVSLRSP